MNRHGRLLVSLCLVLALASQADTATAADKQTVFSRHVVNVLANGVPTEFSVQLLVGSSGALFLRATDMAALGFSTPAYGGIVDRGDLYLPTDSLQALRVYATLEQGQLWLRSLPKGAAQPVKHHHAGEPAPHQPTSPGSERYQEVIVRAVIDHHNSGRELKVLRQGDRWFIYREDLVALALPLPQRPSIMVGAHHYFLLDGHWPFKASIDPTWNLLRIERGEREAEGELSETWLELSVNGSRQSRLVQALSDHRQQFYLTAETLAEFKLRMPQQFLESNGEAFYSVQAMAGVLPVFDPQRQALTLYAKAEAFQASQVDGSDFEYVEPDSEQHGALLNYAVFGSKNDVRDRVSGQFEVGAFWRRGFFSSQHLLRDMTGSERESIRLESSLRIDWHEQMRSLTLGDTLNDAGAWGRPVRFGGFKWGRNFSTQPGFVTFPTELIAGDTVVPSTVDVFVNNVRRSSEPVDPGPFAISNVPVVTGAGEMRIVTRDLLGRETVTTRSFYTSTRLLKAGLHEYSYEAGVLREGFTQRSNDYSRGFVSGSHRYGFNRWFTGEIRGEATADNGAMGLAANIVWPAVAEFNIAVAASRDEDSRSGELLSLGFRRQANRFSVGASATRRSADFAQLGMADGALPDALESTAFAAFSLGRGGNLSLSHIKRERRAEADIAFATLQYSNRLWGRAHLRLSYLEPDSAGIERSLTLSLSMPLGRHNSGQLSRRSEGGQTSQRMEVRRNLPAGRGFGYQLMAESGELDRFEAGGSLRTDVGLFSAQAGQLGEAREYRASIDGGVAFMGGEAFLSQRLDQGFAVVDAGTLSGVDVYRDNQLLATTGDDGKALVPGLRDYQRNRIRLDDASMPLNIQVASLERTVIPAYRHGVKLKFDIKRARWVGFRLVDSTGKALPVGAQFLHMASGNTSLVGAEGQGFIELDPGEHQLKAWWQGEHCRFQLRVPETAEPMPDIGEYICQ